MKNQNMKNLTMMNHPIIPKVLPRLSKYPNISVEIVQ